MPQPLSVVAPNARIILGNAGDRPLMRHPELAVLAMEAIASWSNVESFLLKLFIQLMGGNDALAADVYLALTIQSAKTAAINAAADSTLQKDSKQRDLLRAILAIAKTNEKLRNNLAHWTWGDSPDLPDAILLIDPKSNIGDLNRKDIYVYREHDFNAMIRANDRLCGFGMTLKFILQGHVANQDNSLIDQLCAEPEILEKLNRQA